MTYALGLDFGTTSTAAAVARSGVVHAVQLGHRAGPVPAVVFIGRDGSVAHGEDAVLRGELEPLGVVHNVKRLLGDGSDVVVDGTHYDTVRLVADHLRWAVDRIEHQEHAAADVVVLTHPASWRAARLDRFRAAIELARLDARLITEPHAAAVFHAETFPLAVGDLVATFDLGGGTFDAAVLRRTRHGFDLAGEPEGEAHLGGMDFDDVVFHLVRSRVGPSLSAAEAGSDRAYRTTLAQLRHECIVAKEVLSQDESTMVSVRVAGETTNVVVTRREIEHLIRPSVEESIGSFRRAVSGAGAGLDDLAAVLMVGGSSRLPIVRDLLRSAIGPDLELLDADPHLAVARGAALEGAELLRRDLEAMAALPAPAPVTPPTGEPPAGSRPPAPEVLALGTMPVSPQPPESPTVDLPSLTWSRPSGAAPVGAEPVGAAPVPGRRPSGRVLALAAAVGFLVLAAPLYVALSGDGGDGDGVEVLGRTTEPTAASGGDAEQPDEETGSTSQTDAETPAEPTGVAASEGMVEVPAGTFTVGVPEPGPESVAAFEVTVEGFHLDRFEVTNSEYLQFVQQIGAPPPTGWDRGAVPADADDHPVTGVTFEWALAFCESLDKRLPTDAEWEVAARGPDGALYPTGDTADGLDLDIPGSRPVGSDPDNVSGFGVADLVGSVWEWVDEPYAETDPGMRVRRGGQNGRVRDGAAMRQVVDPLGQATIGETGFRCAADEVDATVDPLVFDADHDRPEVESSTSGPAAVDEGIDSILVSDTFDDTSSGFLTIEEGDWRIGYHAPSWYHLEATRPNAQVMSLGGYDLADGDVELSVSIDKTATEVGRYRYGLVFRAGGAVEEPPVGTAGPQRPSVYYAFVIDPRGGVWELLHEDELPLRTQASGPLPEVRVIDPLAPDVLGVRMDGSSVVLSINGDEVGVFDTRGYHVEAGNVGLYLETFDESLVHVHFDLLEIEPLG